MFKHILILFFLSQIMTKKLKSKDTTTFTFTPTEVNFESLCHNLEKGFSFSIVISENPNYSATFSNIFNLVSTKDNTEIKTLCTLYAGDTEIICSTIEEKPKNSNGPFKVKSVSAFEFNCNIGETSKETKCKFNIFNFTDTVSYSELFSTYNLETPDQTIDYTKEGVYSFHLNFDYIDEQSNTKVFYYDEEDEQNYEITTCDFAFYSDLVLECPVTKATLPCDESECKYQIYIEDDCGIEYDAIVLTVVGKKGSSSSSTSSTSGYNNYGASVNWISVGKVLMGMILVVLV